MNSKKYFRKGITNAIVAAASVIFSLGVIELGVRVFAPQPIYYNPRYLYTADAERGYRLTPGFQGEMRTPESKIRIKINSRGLRDHEHDKRYNTTILGLGDSFAFGTGVGVEDTFLWRLEEMLNEKQKLFDIVKAGVPGYGTDQEYMLLKQEGITYNPDLVIINFYLNDVFDNVTPKFTVIDGYGAPSEKMKAGGKKFTITQWIFIFLDEFDSYRFVINRLSNLPSFRTLFLDYVIKNKGIKGNRLDLYSTSYSPETETAWRVTKEYLKAIDATVKKMHSKILLVYIPERQQVYGDQWEKIRRQYNLNEGDFDILKPNEILESFCRGEGIPFLDLTEGLQQAVKNGRNVYFTMDPHLNREGHNISAGIIYRALAEKRLMPNLQ